jgi:hypothetical protein
MYIHFLISDDTSMYYRQKIIEKKVVRIVTIDFHYLDKHIYQRFNQF